MAEKAEGSEAEKQPKAKLPDDFSSEEDFLEYVRRLYTDHAGYDTVNREEALQDLRFVAGEQWDTAVQQARFDAKRPTLTINRLPAFVAQLVGNRRLNETTIKVIPDNDAHKAQAIIREGLIRSICKNSAAKLAFDKAFENQVYCGIGNWQVVLDYASDDVFDQDILIQPIPNALSVVWDMTACDPTGRDARFCFVSERVSLKDFQRMYPGKNTAGFFSDWDLSNAITTDGWYDKDSVRIVDFWRIRTRERTLALLRHDDGSTGTVDVTDVPLDQYAPRLVVRDDGTPLMRVAKRKYAQMYKCSGSAVLEGPYELPIDRVPVFRAMGWDVNVGDRRVRWGLVRWLRDPMRFHNYWRSAAAEKLMKWPRARWIAPSTAVEGREDAFRKAHINDDPLLVYNGESGAPPVPVEAAQIDVGFVQMAEMAVQDLRDVSNIHEAAFGQQSNEVSGKAILARQRVGELGTVIYTDNLNLAIEETGRVANQLIPYVYDTPRIIKIMPDEGEELSVPINDTANEEYIDITAGKYSITVVTGPSYATKRVEAQESMMAAINAMPDTFAVAGDLIAENMDWPGADKFAKRIRAAMPPGLLGDDIPPERAEQMQQQAQMEQAVADLEAQKVMAEIDEMRARAEQARAQAQKALSDAGVKQDDTEIKAVKTAADIQQGAEKLAIERDKVSQQANKPKQGEKRV